MSRQSACALPDGQRSDTPRLVFEVDSQLGKTMARQPAGEHKRTQTNHPHNTACLVPLVGWAALKLGRAFLRAFLQALRRRS